MSKYILLTVVIIILSILIVRLNKSEQRKGLPEGIKVATCQTMFEGFNGIESVGLVRSSSTYEAVQEFKEGKVEYVLSGRVPKPSEKINNFVILHEGMSFLSDEEITVLHSDLIYMKIYTDLDIQGDEFRNVEKVDNVYEYLDRGIVITSWGNTNYNKSGIVHVLNEDGTRWKYSRAPVLYCNDECPDNLIQILKEWK